LFSQGNNVASMRLELRPYRQATDYKYSGFTILTSKSVHIYTYTLNLSHTCTLFTTKNTTNTKSITPTHTIIIYRTHTFKYLA